MVTFNAPRLSLADGFLYPYTDLAFLLPTAFSPFTTNYGADSCSDHPAPSTASGRVFIPSYHSWFYPDLNDAVSLKTIINGVDTAVGRWLVDSLTINDVPGDGYNPGLFPNSRNMQNTTGWAFSWGTTEGQNLVTPAFVKGGAHLELTVPKAPAAGYFAFITTPRAPVTPGIGYHLTAMMHDAVPDWFSNTNGFTLTMKWYNAAGALLKVDAGVWVEMPDTDLIDNRGWRWLATGAPVQAPAGAASMAATFKYAMTAAADAFPPLTTERMAGLDGVSLHADKGIWDPTAFAGNKRPAGRWVDFSASDISAYTGRLMIASEPWPQQDVDARFGSLRDAVAAAGGNVEFDTYSNILQLAYRDVDNQSALDNYQTILNSIGEIAVASPVWLNRMTFADPARFVKVLIILSTGMAAIIDDPNQVTIPAGAISAGALQSSITGLSNKVVLNYRKPTVDGSEDASASVSNPASIAAYGPMVRTVSTDLTAPEGRAWDKAASLVKTQAAPVYSMADKIKLVTSQIPDTPGVAKLFTVMTGFRRIVIIPDAPALLGVNQRVKAGTFVFGANPSVALDVEPSDQIAPDPINLRDIAYRPDAMFTNVKLPKYVNVRLGDLKTTSAPSI